MYHQSVTSQLYNLCVTVQVSALLNRFNTLLVSWAVIDPGSACMLPVCTTGVELALLRASTIATPIPVSDGHQYRSHKSCSCKRVQGKNGGVEWRTEQQIREGKKGVTEGGGGGGGDQRNSHYLLVVWIM